MAGKDPTVKVKKNILDLPYSVYKELCQVLDMNRNWEELGGEYLKFTLPELYEFRRAVNQDMYGGSPSQAMLTRWQYKNGSIDCLFLYLAKMDLKWGMTILFPYVSPRVKEKFEIKAGVTELLNEFSGPNDGHSSFRYANDYKPDRNMNPGDQWGSSRYNRRVPVQVTATDIGNSLRHERSQIFNDSGWYRNKTPKMPVEGDTPYLPPPATITENDVASTISNFRTSKQPSKALTPKDLPKSERDPAQSHSSNERSRMSPENHISRKPNRDERLPSTSRRPSDPLSISGYPSLPQITFKDIEVCTKNFSTEVLGKGGFGIVYSGHWKETPVAIKYIQKKYNPGLSSTEDAKLEMSLAEVRALDSLRHQNIVSLMGYCLNADSLCLMYQLMPKGSLEDRLHCRKNTPPLTWLQRCRIMEGAACGLQFLHTVNPDCPLIHGDIKSANILLDENLEPKLGDFGLVREGPPSELTHMYVRYVHGTRAYLPIEYLRNNKLSIKVDTYSFGVVLFEVATGLSAYDKNREKERKYLAYHVWNYDESKRFQLRDPKGGKKLEELFNSFINLGLICTEENRQNRPDMVWVFRNIRSILQIAEIKDKEQPIQDLMHSPDLSPIARQHLYDYLSMQNGSQNQRTPTSTPPTPPEQVQYQAKNQDFSNPPSYDEVLRMNQEQERLQKGFNTCQETERRHEQAQGICEKYRRNYQAEERHEYQQSQEIFERYAGNEEVEGRHVQNGQFQETYEKFVGNQQSYQEFSVNQQSYQELSVNQQVGGTNGEPIRSQQNQSYISDYDSSNAIGGELPDLTILGIKNKENVDREDSLTALGKTLEF